MMKVKNRMKIVSCFVFLCLLQISPRAQDYLTGRIADQNSERQTLYDRTQVVPAKNVYHTIYKVLDSNKKPLHSVIAIHERSKSSITIVVKTKGVNSIVNSIKYERGKIGLILSEKGIFDTSFSDFTSHSYLLSFADTSRDYPILHKIETNTGTQIILDPITKLRFRKHNEVVKNVVMNDPELKQMAEARELESKKESMSFETHLLQLRDSLYNRNANLAEQVMKGRNKIEKDIAGLFKSKKVYPDARRYEGEKKSGRAEGNGLFMANSNYYDGLFTDGKFVSGHVIIHYEAYEYCGEYSSDSLNGIGCLKYKDAGYRLGRFKEGTLQDGVTLSISKNGDVYFGTIRNGIRAGYGELYNTKGEMYCGEFINDDLVKGYSKDSDPFGFFIYSKIENGIKMPIDVKRGETFFNPLTHARP
jgi:hypothetical protein